ncbi:MAG: SDR family NAD(P)-dependent oxidoreductase [Pseudomonadota bacterium]
MTQVNRKWFVVTGSTGGIGSEICQILASQGCDLVLVNRSSSSAAAQQSKLRAAHSHLAIETVTADFMDTASVAGAIAEISALPGRIDALYNVAGVLNATKILSAQGYESHFAINLLAPYQLLRGLREHTARSSEARAAVVVNFSSSAIHRQKRLDLDTLVNPDEVTGLMGTYAQSKLALTALSAALATELKADNILIRAVDPGATKSAMTTQNASMPWLLKWLAPLVFANADKQALKVVNAAEPLAFESGTGIFVANQKQKPLPKAAADPQAWQQLVALLDRCLG